MKGIILTTAIFALFCVPAHAQKISLRNKAFVHSFKSQSFTLRNVQPAATNEWQLIAGRPTETRVNADDPVFARVVDSLRGVYIHENVQGLCKDSIEILRRQIAYYECVQKYAGTKDSGLCDSLKAPVRDWSYGSLSTVSGSFDAEVENGRWGYIYQIDYFFSSSKKVSKPAPMLHYGFAKGWATWCPPGYCNWYIAAYQNNKCVLIDNPYKLVEFLGKVNNVHKAYLLVAATNLGASRPYPENGSKFRYRKLGQTFFIIQDLRLSDCPVRQYSCLFSVSAKGEVKLVDKKQIGEDGGCI